MTFEDVATSLGCIKDYVDAWAIGEPVKSAIFEDRDPMGIMRSTGFIRRIP